jgi:hypothetical protein
MTGTTGRIPAVLIEAAVPRRNSAASLHTDRVRETANSVAI